MLNQRATGREWIGLIALALPTLVLAMDLTVLHLAVPTITASLKPSPSQLLWIVDIYGFLLSGSLITMGTIGDRIGRRRLLMIGAAAFALASLLAAFATSAPMLIAARAILGVAGATLAPSTLSLIRSMFHDAHQRTVAVAMWGTGFAAGGALGPLVGGVLLAHFWWGSVFLLSLPVMVAVLIAAPLLLPEYRDSNAGSLDLTSAALSLGAILPTIYGLKLVAQDGLGAVAVAAIVAGVAVGVAFVRRQRGLAHPFIDLELFRARAFNVTLSAFALNAFVMFAASFMNAQYLQLVLGLSPLHAGLWTLPFAATVVVSSMLSPIIARAAPRTVVLSACLFVCALGFGMLSLVGEGGLPVLVAATIVIAMGAGPVGTLASDAIVSTATPDRAGSAASISATTAEFGGALGIALLGSIGVAVYRLAMAGANVPAAARRTLGEAVATSHLLSPQAAAMVVETARAAFARGYFVVALISLGLMLAAGAMMRSLNQPGESAMTNGQPDRLAS